MALWPWECRMGPLYCFQWIQSAKMALEIDWLLMKLFASLYRAKTTRLAQNEPLQSLCTIFVPTGIIIPPSKIRF